MRKKTKNIGFVSDNIVKTTSDKKFSKFFRKQTHTETMSRTAINQVRRSKHARKEQKLEPN